MTGQLITLPLRLTACTASFFLRTSEELLKRALTLTGRAVEAEPRYSPPPASSPPPARRAGPPASREAPPASRPAPPARPLPTQPPPSTPDRSPEHVSREPVLVEEFAEPGAEDGAGAEVRVDEPWDGYAKLSAREVIARVREADLAELITVNLYENAHRGRQTVLSAVERQLAVRGNAPT
jgi:hypothetical protein